MKAVAVRGEFYAAPRTPSLRRVLHMSRAVQIWVEKLPYRSIEIENVRPRGRQRKCLTFAHREFLVAVADHARHNGLAWPSIPLIAKKLGISDRQAYRLEADVKRANLVKVHEGGGRGHSNTYWVRVPWVEEPESVLDLPKLDNKHFPPGARLKRDEDGNVKGIDVEYYVRIASIQTLTPVSGFIDADTETLTPASPNDPQTLTPVSQISAETLTPVSGEPPSLREPHTPGETLALRARGAHEVGSDHVQAQDPAALVQPTLPRFAALAASQGDAAPVSTTACPDCGHAVAANGEGHRGGTNACRAFGRGAEIQRCPSCSEWIDELRPATWHTIWCRLRDDQPAPSQWSPNDLPIAATTNAPPVVEKAADRVVTARETVQLSAEDAALADELERKLEQVRAAEDVQMKAAAG